MVGKVAVIGAGPCGMEVLRHFEKQKREGLVIPEVKCFEKARDWGGQWNYNWRTGVDEFGESCHGSQYRYLWSNGPKEALEFPDYTFEDHYGKAIPSFPPREVLYDYLQGRWKKADVRKYIKFCHIVKDVCYNPKTDDFTVLVKDLENDRVMDGERFDYVIVASGHYSVPHAPYFKGIEKFPGRVAHAHDFRDANEFAGKNLLLIGASYSAEDIALQVVKYGAKNVICSWRSKPMGFKWPKEIQERPLLLRLDGKTAHFKDGSTAEIDAIILCTGYKHSYPFLRENLRLQCGNILYPPNLYKGLVWTKGGNGKLLYVSTQDNYYTFTMFDAQAMWAVKLIQGEITLPSQEEQEAEWKPWYEKLQKVNGCHEGSDFQGEYVNYIVKDLGSDYPYNLDVGKMFHQWLDHKKENIVTYRDQSFTSLFTGTKSPIHHTNFMKALDDTLDTFMHQRKNKDLKDVIEEKKYVNQY
jgi:trimethylamine monooxygenase